MDIETKSQKYQMFVDYSGSVSGSVNYWSMVNDILTLYGPDIDAYYLWDTSLYPCEKKRLESIIERRQGRGGTSPEVVAQTCKKQLLRNIILITDGEVGDYSVKRCDEILANHKFDKTICYIISSSSYARYGGASSLNMSVTCAFTRNCESKVFMKEFGQPLQSMVQYTQEDFKVLDTLDTITLENFEAQYDKIEGVVIAQNMGKEGNIPLKNDLVVMKNRLIKEFAKKKGGEKKELSVIVREFLEKGDFKSAMTEIENSSKAYLQDNTAVELERKIAHLISLCGDLRGKYDLNQIKSNKMATAQNATEGEVAKEVEVTDLSKNPIECPILLDEDVPQILVDECDPILLGVEKNIVDDIVACPLRLLNYPNLKNKLKSRLSNYVGVMGIKAKFNKNLLKNPFTQNRLLGGIPLGTHKSHVAVGNYTIAKLIAGGKIMGNMNLYYAVIWHLIQEKSIEYLKDIESNATEHLIFRLKNSKTYASMCGQAQFFNTQVSTDIALWYCVNSGSLNQPTDRDTFRFHFYDLEPMVKIVQTLKYPNHEGLMSHYSRTKALFGFLTVYKTMRNKHDKKSLENMLKGLYQNGVFVDVKKLNKKFIDTEVCSVFVPVDGPASPEQLQKIRTQLGERYPFTKPLTNQELLFISNMIDAKKHISQHVLDYNVVVPALPEPETNWQYGLANGPHDSKICPKTLRPYHVENTIKEESSQVLKEHKYFEEFVFKYDKLPTVDELVVFFYNRYVESGKCKTLPFMVLSWAEQLIEQYRPHFESLSSKKVRRVFNASRAMDKRIKLEAEI